MKKIIIAAALLAATASSAQVNGYAPIQTSFKISGPTVIDPPAGEKADRLALFMSGPGAKKIYDAMLGPAVSTCGGKDKRSGGLVCHLGDDKTYACSAAILLKTGETRQHLVC